MGTYSYDKEERSFMGMFLRWALFFAVVVILLGALGNAAGWISFSFWAPKMEQARFNTFKESQAYNDGMLRDLQELRLNYISATPEQQQAMKSIILHRFSIYDTARLPTDLQLFYHSIQTGGL